MLQPLTHSALSDRRRRGVALLEHPPAAALPTVTVLSTFSVELLAPLLAEALERWGHPTGGIATGPFGQIAQELLSATSSLYRDAPEALLLVLAVEDLLGPLFSLANARLAPEDAAALADRRVEELRSWIRVALERLPTMTCYVTLVGPCNAPVEHVLSPLEPERGQQAVLRLQEGVRALAGQVPRTIVIDWDWHVRPLGSAALHDPRLWYLARMRLNPQGLATLAELVACHVAARPGASHKVAAIDLDGVLWGGVVGEVGTAGIELGEEGVGLAFQDFQRELLRLRDLGVLLALCSKNNRHDAEQVFAQHPAMVLRREHFAAERINWQDKASNLRELAQELNVGLDSFVFLDDSPIERDWVRQALPEVAVVELPEDPVDRPAALRAVPYFRRIALTEADRGRAGTYQAERRRRELASSTVSFEQFLASLEQQASIEPMSEASLARAAQLCQRTNQFNLTTRRYDEAQLEAMLNDDGVELYTLSVNDRFGDSGITGFAILRLDDGQAEIDTLLLSCRILGRRLEDALLAFLAERAHALGARSLIGRFEATAKNAQVADFYPTRDFHLAEAGSFRLDLGRHRPKPPPETYVRLVASA